MFHRYDPPPVPVKVVEVPDVIVTSSPLFAVGPGFIPTITVEVAVQPLVVSVTVTVYVPGKFTVGVDVDPPAVIPAPVQVYVAPVVVEFADSDAKPVIQFMF